MGTAFSTSSEDLTGGSPATCPVLRPVQVAPEDIDSFVSFSWDAVREELIDGASKFVISGGWGVPRRRRAAAQMSLDFVEVLKDAALDFTFTVPDDYPLDVLDLSTLRVDGVRYWTLHDVAHWASRTGSIRAPREVRERVRVVLERYHVIHAPYAANLLRAVGWRVIERQPWDESLALLDENPTGACLGIGRRIRRSGRRRSHRRQQSSTLAVGSASTLRFIVTPSTSRERSGGAGGPATGTRDACALAHRRIRAARRGGLGRARVHLLP